MATCARKIAPPSQWDVENQMIEVATSYIHDAGRIVPYDDLLDIIQKEKPVSYSVMFQTVPNWSLLTVLKDCHVFYVFDLDDYTYVSFTRNYAYLNPRFAKCLENVEDKHKETVIQCPEGNVGDGLLSHFVKVFQEYEFAKCALAVLDILNMVYKCVPKGKYKVPFKRVVEKLNGLCRFSKAIVHFCGKEEDSIILEKFLCLYKFVFKFESALLSVDFYLLDGLIKAHEIDLIWSYAGICMARGVRSLIEIHRRVNAMIGRAKMRFTSELSMENIVEMFTKRMQQFYMPGDGSIHITYPCLDNTMNEMIAVREYFMNYLKKKKRPKRLHYTKCHEVLKKNPILWKEFERQDNTSIACILFVNPGEFSFMDGFISLAPEGKQVKLPRIVTPVEVPITMFHRTHPNREERVLNALGLVHEVGIRSATIRFNMQFTPDMVPEGPIENVLTDVYAYCHRSACRYEDEIVEDFSRLLKLKQCVRFQFVTTNEISVLAPYYCNVVNIMSHHEPEPEQFFDYRDPSEEYQSDDSNESDSTLKAPSNLDE